MRIDLIDDLLRGGFTSDGNAFVTKCRYLIALLMVFH